VGKKCSGQIRGGKRKGLMEEVNEIPKT